MLKQYAIFLARSVFGSYVITGAVKAYWERTINNKIWALFLEQAANWSVLYIVWAIATGKQFNYVIEWLASPSGIKNIIVVVALYIVMVPTGFLVGQLTDGLRREVD